MPVTYIGQHTRDANKTSSTNNLNVILARTVPAGRLIVAHIGFDNTGTGTPTVSSIAKQSGETANWASIASHNSSTATSAGGCRGEMWAILTTREWDAASYVITLSAAVTAKAVVVAEFNGATATARSTSGTGTSTTSAPSATSTGTTPVINDLCLGGGTFETNTAPTGSAAGSGGGGTWLDDTNVWASSGGGAATNNAVILQYKITSAAAHQQYLPTNSTSTDSGACVAVLQPLATNKTLPPPYPIQRIRPLAVR